jgi:hypothetical protein
VTYRDQDAERRGQPVRALGDSTGERAAVSLIGLTMLALALIGMYVSFQTVYAYVHPWFRDTAWAVPVAIDVAILVFSAADLLLSYWRMAKPSMRLIPWGFTAATIGKRPATRRGTARQRTGPPGHGTRPPPQRHHRLRPPPPLRTPEHHDRLPLRTTVRSRSTGW